jgi:hypothetical protein
MTVMTWLAMRVAREMIMRGRRERMGMEKEEEDEEDEDDGEESEGMHPLRQACSLTTIILGRQS